MTARSSHDLKSCGDPAAPTTAHGHVRRFVVVALPRTGTNYVRVTLNQHPNIVASAPSQMTALSTRWKWPAGRLWADYRERAEGRRGPRARPGGTGKGPRKTHHLQAGLMEGVANFHGGKEQQLPGHGRVGASLPPSTRASVLTGSRSATARVIWCTIYSDHWS